MAADYNVIIAVGKICAQVFYCHRRPAAVALMQISASENPCRCARYSARMPRLRWRAQSISNSQASAALIASKGTE